jgi:hypothetical protein
MEVERENGNQRMGKGEWVKGMVSALWVAQGRPERGGKLAAAFRR